MPDQESSNAANPSAVQRDESKAASELNAAPSFTPGPYKFRLIRFAEEPPVGFVVYAETKRPDAAPVASVNAASGPRHPCADFSPEELEANARLFTAAPALYQALRLMVELWESSNTSDALCGCTDEDRSVGVSAVECEYHIALDALTLATKPDGE